MQAGGKLRGVRSSLEGFGVRSYGRGIDDGNEYAGICDLGSAASLTADKSTNRSVNFPGIRPISHDVPADVFLLVAVDDEHIDEGLLLCSERIALELTAHGAQF